MLRASKHFDGAGLEFGVDRDTTLTLNRTAKADSMYKFKATLEAIQSACMWPADRIADSANPAASRLCPRCGLKDESSFHCFWECCKNLEIDDEAVTSTENLKYQAGADVEHQCMWLRGILPADLVHIPQEHEPPSRVIPTVVSSTEPNRHRTIWLWGLLWGWLWWT